MYVFRFTRKTDTLPTTWTYPGTGEHEGAQVWDTPSFFDTLMNDGKASGWTDGFDYNPRNGYEEVIIMKVSGTSGDSGPLSWKAVTEADVEAAWSLDFRSAQSAIEELGIDLAEEGAFEDVGLELPFGAMPYAMDWYGESEDDDRMIEALLSVARKADLAFERTVTDAAVEA